MIPKDKFDIEAVTQLSQLAESDIIPLLPELLTWIQDMNWPVAKSVVEVLLCYPNEITPLIEKVLIGEDDQWIYNCLVEVVPKLPFYSKLVLVDRVEQLASGCMGLEDVITVAQQALHSFTP